MKHFESHGRSIAKAFSWKLISSVVSFFIAYLITGRAGDSLKVAVVFFFVGLILFYLHERAWNYVHWGKFRRGSD